MRCLEDDLLRERCRASDVDLSGWRRLVAGEFLLRLRSRGCGLVVRCLFVGLVASLESRDLLEALLEDILAELLLWLLLELLELLDVRLPPELVVRTWVVLEDVESVLELAWVEDLCVSALGRTFDVLAAAMTRLVVGGHSCALVRWVVGRLQ